MKPRSSLVTHHSSFSPPPPTRRPAFRWLACCLLAVCLGGTLPPAFAQDDPAGPEAVGVDVFAQQQDEAAPSPIGPPGGRAERSAVPVHPSDIMAAMGAWLLPFVIASVIAVWFGIERLVVLRRNRVIPKPFVERFLQHLEQGQLDSQTAAKLCEQSESPVAAVFAHGVRKWGKPSVEVEQAIIDGGERQVSQLRKHLRVLNGVATVTPLLGLLGTVWGMIQAFNDIANSGAMGKADELAGGIALALLTTAFGLAIAIPSLIVYMYLAGRVDALVMEMDLLAQDVVQLISAEGLAAGRQREAGEGRPPRPSSLPVKKARVRPPAGPPAESKEAG